MKKTASLLVLATLGFASLSHAQSSTPARSTQSSDAPFAGPLADRRPTPKASAAPVDNGGKRTVGDVMFATDDKGKNVTTSFPSGTTTVYVATKNVSGKKGDKIVAEWFSDENSNKALPKGKRFFNSAVELPDTAQHNPNFHATGPIKGVFPPGKYRVDVSVGGEKLKSAKFAVQ